VSILSQINPVQQPHSISLIFTLILSSHLRRRFLNDVFPIKILQALLCAHMRTTWPAHIYILNLIILITSGERVQVMKLLVQFSRTFYHFIPLEFNHSPRHPVLKYLPCSLLNGVSQQCTGVKEYIKFAEFLLPLSEEFLVSGPLSRSVKIKT
jgi:hypothetical protein